MTRWLLLLALACSDISLNPPNITDLCPRAVVAIYTASADECILLNSVHDTLFRLETSESCGGPDCLRLEPRQTGYALERLKPGEPAVWSFHIDECDRVPECE